MMMYGFSKEAERANIYRVQIVFLIPSACVLHDLAPILQNKNDTSDFCK